MITSSIDYSEKFDTGYRVLRYITIMDGLKKRTLFYGTDLLRKTSISAANIARKHFNLSLAGYCCRINLPKELVRCLSLNSSEGYFYDFKGMMHVAFNFYGFKEQVAMVKNLYYEWSSNDENDVLPQFIKVDVKDVIREHFNPVTLTDDFNHDCSSIETNDYDSQAQNQKQGNISELHGSMSESSIINVQLPDSTDDTHALNDNSNISNINECQINIESLEAHTQTDFAPEHSINCRVQKKQKHNFENCNNHHQSCHRLLEALSGILKEFYDHYIDDIFFYKVYNLIDAFLFLLNDELDTVIATTTGIFPFHLLTEFVNIKRSSKADTFGIDYYQISLLNIFGKWLGMQFCNFGPVISKQVSEFKECLLQKNQFLPSAAKVLNDEKLFPKCMVNFLNFWLNQKLENEEFHSSKILLVLELLNDELLTGVGHVVYAKLKNTL